MIAEKNIQKFLESFNRNDKVHSRVLRMLTASASGEYDILGMVDDLVKSSVNAENLQFLLDEHKKKDVDEAVSFDERSCLKDKFQLYLTSNTLPDGTLSNEVDNHLGEEPAEKPDKTLSEEMTKRLKISKLQENVNKYSEKEIGNVVDSLKSSSRECVIPGLGSLVSEEDSDDRSLHGATGPEKYSEIPHNSHLGKHQNKGDFSGKSSSTGQFENKIHGTKPNSLDDHHTHRNAFDHSSARDASKDTVFFQSLLPMNDSSSSRPRDPSYLYPVLQCKLCGLRFTRDSTEQFGLHIEDHRRKTKALGDKMVLRREFFSSKSVNRIEKLELEVEGSVESIVWEKEPPYCVICGKIIKKVWSDEVENWVLDCGTKINDKEFAHRVCVL